MFGDWRAVNWWPTSFGLIRATRSSSRSTSGAPASQNLYDDDAVSLHGYHCGSDGGGLRPDKPLTQEPWHGDGPSVFVFNQQV
jgi:hypothetical protein